MGRDHTRRMTHAALGGVLAALCGCDSSVVYRAPQPAVPVMPAHRVPAPPLAFEAPGEPVLTLQSFAGRVTVVSVWATWCAPCLKELPALDRLAVRMPGIAVVPINVDIDATAAHAWFTRLGLWNLREFRDPDGHAMRSIGVNGLPAALVVDRDGNIAAIVHGAADWTSDTMLDVLRRAGEPEGA